MVADTKMILHEVDDSVRVTWVALRCFYCDCGVERNTPGGVPRMMVERDDRFHLVCDGCRAEHHRTFRTYEIRTNG